MPTIQDDKLELGPCNLYLGVLPQASKDTNPTPTDADLRFVAQKGGAAGNSISVVINALAGSTTTVAVVGNTITVSPKTAETADGVKNAINADPGAYALIYAVRANGSNGTGTIVAGTFNLAGGSDTGVSTFLGALGEETVFEVTLETAALTAAQSGNLPRNKVIIGGNAVLRAPLKEMSLDTFSRAFPGGILVVGGGGLRRLEFTVPVGKKLRPTTKTALTLKKIIGSVESTNPEDVLTIPDSSPVDAGPVQMTFNPVQQRVMAAAFQAWPDPTTSLLAYFGTGTL